VSRATRASLFLTVVGGPVDDEDMFFSGILATCLYFDGNLEARAIAAVPGRAELVRSPSANDVGS
jgi:hypothetical protein